MTVNLRSSVFGSWGRRRFSGLVVMWLLSSSALASPTINSIRLHASPEKTRLVFDVSEPLDHTLFVLENPLRLVIDLPGSALEKSVRRQSLASKYFKGTAVTDIRYSSVRQADLRVVLDLSESVKPRSFLLNPIAQYGDRLVVDLFPTLTGESVLATESKIEQRLRDIVVAIDPGHGGEDPGAIGPGKTYEKTVVLAIAKRLADRFNAEPGFKAVLTRGGDYYVAHRDRTQLARDNQADVFISIHADAWKTASASGASVFAISQRGATSETARWIAEKENRADLIGGVGSVSLDDKDDVLAGVLLDLSMTASLSASLEMGAEVIKSISPINKLHKSNVEQASFIVLKSPDIPSILVETGFISNPGEAKKLRTAAHQKKMAGAIFKGVSTYFQKTPPEGTLLAQRVSQLPQVMAYKIKSGDTLSEIAQRYRVSQGALKSLNALKSDRLRVGQVLKIPERS
ncbi:MAG: AMIN domain-containing protein [Gammaproteobacteria bacterium]|jgi:N-acetylmuramoyl-L-alanine amidase|nr:AMIN domain-containing protein [Gammaproteobacteria bacterium]MBT5053207.1 AMIN domain-containing protein [Gammaproteobacteria bacterium]